jgi:hypothetical protein
MSFDEPRGGEDLKILFLNFVLKIFCPSSFVAAMRPSLPPTMIMPRAD